MKTKQLLTHSRKDCFQKCRRQHWFAYTNGIRRTDDAKALRQGSAFHSGLDALGSGRGSDAACEAVRDVYYVKPDYIEQTEWDYECETILRLVLGYEWRWENDQLEYVATERVFQLPLLNPATNRKNRTFDLAGKIDGIVRLGNGRLAVKESKTTSEDLGSDEPLWRRLRIDHQISLYVLAARRLGFQVDCVLYDVTRKPSIKPTQVPLLDENGEKVVVNQYGDRVQTKAGGWRQTGDTEKGYTLLSRPMTATEWGDKLTTDIGNRPELYYARVEVPRIDGDLEQYAVELWDIAGQIADAEKHNRNYRTVNKDTCAWCPYFSMCTEGWREGDRLPEGFTKLSNINPELANDSRIPAPGIETQTTRSAPADDCPF